MTSEKPFKPTHLFPWTKEIAAFQKKHGISKGAATGRYLSKDLKKIEWIKSRTIQVYNQGVQQKVMDAVLEGITLRCQEVGLNFMIEQTTPTTQEQAFYDQYAVLDKDIVLSSAEAHLPPSHARVYVGTKSIDPPEWNGFGRASGLTYMRADRTSIEGMIKLAKHETWHLLGSKEEHRTWEQQKFPQFNGTTDPSLCNSTHLHPVIETCSYCQEYLKHMWLELDIITREKYIEH